LTKFCEKNDAQNIYEILHKIKGSAALYGFDHLSESASVLMQQAEQGNIENTYLLIDEISQILKSTGIGKAS